MTRDVDNLSLYSPLIIEDSSFSSSRTNRRESLFDCMQIDCMLMYANTDSRK